MYFGIFWQKNRIEETLPKDTTKRYDWLVYPVYSIHPC